jgi:hypothetical protein
MDGTTKTFRHKLEHEVLRHPVIVANPYTRWFSEGTFDREQARAFLVQFSVFSNQFLLAQLHKVVNASTLEDLRASKEILANEIGVGFCGPRRGSEPGLGSTEGSVEGGTFHFRAAHFELLVRMAHHFDLTFADLGRRRFGTRETVFFCDQLIRLYGHENYSIAAAASWAVENWAAAGFWNDLVLGWRRFGARNEVPGLDIGFFTWHARLEANHARHTWAELEASERRQPMNQDVFVQHANEMLDAVHIFWQGLDNQRRALAAATPRARAV